MFFSSFDNNGYESRYLDARKKIDFLCDMIVARKISAVDAKEEYVIIELKYTHPNMEGIELFRMIYKNRVDRLCRQFLGKAYDAC